MKINNFFEKKVDLKLNCDDDKHFDKQEKIQVFKTIDTILHGIGLLF